MDRDPAKCRARRTDGEPCGRFPTRGADVCRSHGGGAPQVRAAAAERLLDEQARAALAQLGTPGGTTVENPLVELSKLAGELVAFKNICGAMVNRLNGQIRYEDARGAEQLRSEVVLLERAYDRCAQVLGLMARLRIDERLAAVSEETAAMLVRAVDAGLAAAGVTGDAREPARRAVAREMRILNGGGAAGGSVA